MIGKILFSIIAITLIALTVIHLTQKDFSQTITGETISQTAEKIVAYVNDHPITEEEVQKAQEYLEAQSERMVNRTEAIQRVIDEKLILDDAQKPIAVSWCLTQARGLKYMLTLMGSGVTGRASRRHVD